MASWSTDYRLTPIDFGDEGRWNLRNLTESLNGKAQENPACRQSSVWICEICGYLLGLRLLNLVLQRSGAQRTDADDAQDDQR